MVDLFQDILNKNYQKVDDLVRCLSSEGCIRKNILGYFDEPNLKDSCEMCSNCVALEMMNTIPMRINENYASDEDISKLSEIKIDHEKEELHIVLLKAIGIDRRIPKKDFVKILKGDLHRFSAKWKFELTSYELLINEEEAEIEETLNKLVSDSLVEITPDGELRITKKGIDLIDK